MATLADLAKLVRSKNAGPACREHGDDAGLTGSAIVGATPLVN
jgi:hypothetical protein